MIAGRPIWRKMSLVFQNQIVAGASTPSSDSSGDLDEGSGVLTPKGDVVAVGNTMKMEVQIVCIKPPNSESTWNDLHNAEVGA